MGGREPGKGNPKSLFGGESGGAYENKQRFIITFFFTVLIEYIHYNQ